MAETDDPYFPEKLLMRVAILSFVGCAVLGPALKNGHAMPELLMMLFGIPAYIGSAFLQLTLIPLALYLLWRYPAMRNLRNLAIVVISQTLVLIGVVGFLGNVLRWGG